MDHIRILNQIRDEKNLERSFYYAIHDRTQKDYYFDYFEMDYVLRNKEQILKEIKMELFDLDNYKQRTAYAYYPPKTDLCYRRMIYIPFKDLVIRYAFVIILANYLDNSLSVNCFANRRAKDSQASKFLLEDFAKESWPKFCNWQKQCIEKYNVLLRTDISSFYDSISHDYLKESIKAELSVDADTAIMKLFIKLLHVPVTSYSHLSGQPVEFPEVMKQGLPIGNQTEGFLANIYLKSIDELIQKINGVDFGRYNDDMRIFAKKRQNALDAVIVLQQQLLTKGLNLNATKTKIAENKQKMNELRSKDYDVYDYFTAEDEDVNQDNIEMEIDRGFDDFNREFKPDAKIEKDDAKDFCKFLSATNKQKEMFLPLKQRLPEHILKLEEILIQFGGASRHACWLIVQSAFYSNILLETQKKAKEVLFNSLENEQINAYTKYRLIHHLIKPRKSSTNLAFRFYTQLTENEKKKLHNILPNLLRQPAFELNIISLYTLKIMGASFNELEKYVQDYIPKPIGEPIKNALSYSTEPVEMTKFVEIVTTEEPDNIAEQY